MTANRRAPTKGRREDVRTLRRSRSVDINSAAGNHFKVFAVLRVRQVITSLRMLLSLLSSLTLTEPHENNRHVNRTLPTFYLKIVRKKHISRPRPTNRQYETKFSLLGKHDASITRPPASPTTRDMGAIGESNGYGLLLPLRANAVVLESGLACIYKESSQLKESWVSH